AVHTQLVLIPGINDGAHLERSISDLVALYPAVRSIAIVPVGVTRYHAPGLRAYTPEEARQLLDQVRPWQRHCQKQFGVTLVYPSDEWYLLAGRPIPPATAYDDFAQLENGVGIVRQFLDAWKRLKSRLQRRGHRVVCAGAEAPRFPKRTSAEDEGQAGIIVVCGQLAAPILQKVCDEMGALAARRITVFPILNHWYGGNVAVSGLLTGRDIIAQLRSRETHGQVVLLPRVMFDSTGQVTLDDMTPRDIEQALGVPVVVAQSPGDIWSVL
ncbi:MAG: DUF512 domain-containing protein, partial [Anaerolineae bacterium]|nr:DUF512 domain-containing protein [Anaerolineae bacterium]